jgi:CBS domain-containing protein
MKVADVMTNELAVCEKRTPLQEVARMMVDCDCGEIPVVEDETSRRPIGVVTDRDIVVRAVAGGRNPLELTAADCMSAPALTVSPETSLKDCRRVMEEGQIRRVPVVDEEGSCCGIVALADLFRHGADKDASKIVKEVSRERQPTSRTVRQARSASSRRTTPQA